MWQSLTITLSYPATTIQGIKEGVICRENYCVRKNGMSEESVLILQANHVPRNVQRSHKACLDDGSKHLKTLL